jgi:hypothetical protein
MVRLEMFFCEVYLIELSMLFINFISIILCLYSTRFLCSFIVIMGYWAAQYCMSSCNWNVTSYIAVPVSSDSTVVIRFTMSPLYYFQETYYISPLCHGPSQKISKGKLPDKLRNKRKAIKALGITATSSQQQIHAELPTIVLLQVNSDKGLIR